MSDEGEAWLPSLQYWQNIYFSVPAFSAANPPAINSTITYTCKAGFFFDRAKEDTTLTIQCLENNVYSDPGVFLFFTFGYSLSCFTNSKFKFNLTEIVQIFKYFERLF